MRKVGVVHGWQRTPLGTGGATSAVRTPRQTQPLQFYEREQNNWGEAGGGCEEGGDDESSGG